MVKVKIERYKETGKWYDTTEIEANESAITDTHQWLLQNYSGWGGHIVAYEVMEDGFLQPLRILTKDMINK